MNRNLSKKGFTLLELIIVLALLAILASVAVARFVDMAKRAFDVQERTTIASLRTAVFLYYAKYERWYANQIGSGENPFELLDNAPPSYFCDPPVGDPCPDPEGKRWTITRWECINWPCTIWVIRCPHYDWQNQGPGGFPNRGRSWYYVVLPDSGTSSNCLQNASPGQIRPCWGPGH